MYSVVMMMALTGTAEAAECGRLRCGCHGSYYACSGCYGSCSCYGCSGCSCYGGCTGFRTGCYGCYGSFGCSGCACWGSTGYYGNPPVIMPATPPAPAAEPIPVPPKMTRAPATIQVNVPNDAVVYFDGFRTTVSGNRRFTTPGLEQGKTYFYNVKVEIDHDGQTVAREQRIIVRAGEQAQLTVDVAPTGLVTARQN